MAEQSYLQIFEQWLSQCHRPSTTRFYKGLLQAMGRDPRTFNQDLLNEYFSDHYHHTKRHLTLWRHVKECFQLDVIVPENQYILQPRYRPRITPEQIKQMAAYYSKDLRLQVLILLYFETGLRLKELMSIHKQDIDFEARTIRVKENKVAFSEQLNHSIQALIFLQPKDHNYVFRRGPHSQLISEVRSLEWSLKKAVLECDLPNICARSIRQSFGFHLAQHEGVSYFELKEKMRLKDPRSIGRYYMEGQK